LTGGIIAKSLVKDKQTAFYNYAYTNTPLAIRHVEGIIAVERKNSRKFSVMNAVCILDSDP
jgi:hypothetical protein